MSTKKDQPEIVANKASELSPVKMWDKGIDPETEDELYDFKPRNTIAHVDTDGQAIVPKDKKKSSDLLRGYYEQNATPMPAMKTEQEEEEETSSQTSSTGEKTQTGSETPPA